MDYKPFWVHKLLPNDTYPPFNKRGYYLLPQENLHLLKEKYKSEADIFFQDTRELLDGVPEWKN